MTAKPILTMIILSVVLFTNGCTLLGAEYKSTSTETTHNTDVSDRVKSLESRVDRLERKIDRLEEKLQR